MKSVQTFDIIKRIEGYAYFDDFNAIHCPHCDTLQIPDFRYSMAANNNLYLLCYCQECNSAYIAEYNCGTINNSSGGKFSYSEISFSKSYPSSYKKGNFSEYISSISPRFIEIYNQSLTADSFQLNEIAGMGYRKALEFLVKDFLISLYLDDKDKISSEKLFDSINRLSDNTVKQFAHACRILSNDDTHYISKFESKDTDDIKSLIEYIVNYISNYSIASKVIKK